MHVIFVFFVGFVGCSNNARSPDYSQSYSAVSKNKIYTIKEKIKKEQSISLMEVKAAYKAAGIPLRLIQTFSNVALYQGGNDRESDLYYFKDDLYISATEGMKIENEYLEKGGSKEIYQTTSRINNNNNGAKNSCPSPLNEKSAQNIYCNNEATVTANKESDLIKHSVHHVEPAKIDDITRKLIDHITEQCKELGFKYGTTRFGDCFMKLLEPFSV